MNIAEIYWAWIATIDPASVVLGMVIAHVGLLLILARHGLPKPKAHEYTWVRPEVLPPVGCPLVINISGVPFRAERVSYIRERNDVMDYRLSTGEVIAGRFEWTYP